MKRRFLSTALLIMSISCARAHAQIPSAIAGAGDIDIFSSSGKFDTAGAQNLFRTSASATLDSSFGTRDFVLVPALNFTPIALTEFAAPNGAWPAPSQPQKGSRVSNSSQARFQMGFGFTFVRFRSTPFSASLYGLDTSISGLLTKSLAFEADLTAAFGPHVFNNSIDQTRYAGIMGGPKIIWPKDGWEPWGHVLAGLSRVNPQVAGQSKNGVGIQVGGGVDFPLSNEVFWLRVEGDYLRSQLYGTGQNNLKGVIGIVVRF